MSETKRSFDSNEKAVSKAISSKASRVQERAFDSMRGNQEPGLERLIARAEYRISGKFSELAGVMRWVQSKNADILRRMESFDARDESSYMPASEARGLAESAIQAAMHMEAISALMKSRADLVNDLLEEVGEGLEEDEETS